MRTLRSSIAVHAVLGLVLLILAAPDALARGSGPKIREAPRAIVHAGPAGPAQQRPTSFDASSRGSRDALAGAAGELVAVGSSKPTVTSGFDALADLDGFFPSDTVGALGRTAIVTAVNASLGVFNASDGTAVVPRTSLASISGEAALLQFDPKVVYDPYADTFVLVWLGFDDAPRTSVIFALAIPDATAADIGTWCLTSFLGDQVAIDGAQWADYPGLGYTDDRVTITTNQFDFSNAFEYSQVLSVDKGLYDCTQPAPVPVVFAGSQTADPGGVQAFTIQPAQMVGIDPGAQLLASFQLVPGRFDYLTIWRIEPTAAGLVLDRGNVPTGKVSLPPLGTQAGGLSGGSFDQDLFWDVGDERLVNAFYDADRGSLFTAHAVRARLRPDRVTGGYVESAIEWYEIAPAVRPARSVLTRKGVIGKPEADLGWPTVATDGTGNLFITYSRASAPRDEFLSAWVAEITPGSTIASQRLMRAGAATYDASPGLERWGDYTGINRSPLDPRSIATFNQYAATTDTWQQVVHVVRHT